MKKLKQVLSSEKISMDVKPQQIIRVDEIFNSNTPIKQTVEIKKIKYKVFLEKGKND